MVVEIAKRLVPYVIPICHLNERSAPVVVGSGVVVSTRSEAFLLTAAHVVDENETGTLYVPGVDNELVPLRELAVGDSHRTSIPDGTSRDDDIYDFAYVELNPGALGPALKTVPATRLNPNHRISGDERYQDVPEAHLMEPRASAGRAFQSCGNVLPKDLTM